MGLMGLVGVVGVVGRLLGILVGVGVVILL